jgi:4-methylaminobutanoate oxidase (formaldehyde-forming)
VTRGDERLRDDTITARGFAPRADDDPPDRARAVVVGAGIVGCSVAYHLAALGRDDVVLLERAKVGSGTSWHAAGLITRARGSHVQTELAMYSRDFYAGLAADTGIDVGYHENGSLSVAQSAERMIELDYGLALARSHGLPARRLDRGSVAAAWPPVDPDGLVGGVLFAGDATVNPGYVTLATAKGAVDRGVRLVEDCRVVGLRLRGDAVAAVETDRGAIACEVVVIAAGLWSRALGALAGVPLALYPAQHMWAQSAPVAGADRDLPILRDLDGHVYVRPYRGGYVVGAFEPDGLPCPPGSLPADFAFGELPGGGEHFAPSLEKARRRVPSLRGAAIEHFLNAPESFTPDGAPLLGETAEVTGLFVAAGLNSQGIILGPGLGRALAAWIVAGAPTVDAAELDVRRFAAEQAGEAWLAERTRETLGRLYAMHWPHLQPATARGLRRGPLYDRLAAARACFGEAAAWERADWFAPPGVEPAYRYSYGRQDWFEPVAAEHRAARKGVALFDLSSYAKVRVEGAGALSAVQRACSADLDRPVGAVAYSCLLNAGGGIEADVTVTRLGHDAFLVVAPTVTQRAVAAVLRRACGAEAVATDVTSGLGVLALAGPRSRALLQDLTEADLGRDAFPWATARTIEVAWARALALRVCYAGELGWELYVPSESLVALYDRVTAAGRPHGLRPAGMLALDGLRAEKGFRHWGADMGPADRPDEAGLVATVALGKSQGFTGRAALLAGPPAGRARRLVGIRLDEPGPLLLGGEPVLADGKAVGRVTSGAYGHTVGAAVGLALLEAPRAAVEELLADARVVVDMAGERAPATLSTAPFYDPSGARLRS